MHVDQLTMMLSSDFMLCMSTVVLQRGESALMRALRRRHTDIAVELIKAKAKLDLQDEVNHTMTYSFQSHYTIHVPLMVPHVNVEWVYCLNMCKALCHLIGW